MLLVICHLSCHVIGYEGSKCDWFFLIHLLSQLDGHWLLVKLSFVQWFYCCQLSTRVLFRTKLTQTIIFHLLMKWPLGYTSCLYLSSGNHLLREGLNQFRAIIISTCFFQVGMGCFWSLTFSANYFILFFNWKFCFP